jgi:glutamate-1-semialdehyde aminotransferase
MRIKFSRILIAAVVVAGAAPMPSMSAHAALPVTVPVREKTIEEVFEAIQARLDALVATTDTALDRQVATGTTRLQRLVQRGVAAPIIDKTADKLKSGFRKQTRTFNIRLNREIGRAMFELRRHRDYDPEYQSRLSDAVDEANAQVTDLLTAADAAIDAVVTPAN